MPKTNRVTNELLFLTALCLLVTALANQVDHPRLPLMLLITGFMGVMAAVSLYRHRAQVRTLRVKGSRKMQP